MARFFLTKYFAALLTYFKKVKIHQWRIHDGGYFETCHCGAQPKANPN